MLISTKRGIVDLEKVTFLDTYKGNCSLNTDELQISLSDAEDKLLAEYFFSAGAITGDSILQLAQAIQELRNPTLTESNELSIADLLMVGVSDAYR